MGFDKEEEDAGSGSVGNAVALPEVDAEYKPSHNYRDAAEEVVGRVLKEAMEPLSSWTNFSSANNVSAYKKEIGGQSMPVVRCESVIPATPLVCLHYLWDISAILKMDPSLKRAECLEYLDNQARIMYTETKPRAVIAPRNFVVLQQIKAVGAGYLFSVCSVAHNDLERVEGKGCVHGTVRFLGWLLEPCGEDSCNVKYVMSVEVNGPQGQLPGWALALAVKDQPGLSKNLSALVATYQPFDQDLGEMTERLCARAEQAADELLAVAEEDGWDLVLRKHNVDVYKKEDEELIHKFKGVGVVPVPPNFLLKWLKDTSQRRKWDKMVRQHRVVEELGESRVEYFEMQAARCLVTRSRDFCVVTKHKVVGDTHVMAAVSVEHPRCPISKHSVRGDLKCSGWVWKPMNMARHSQTTYMVQVDVRGGIPKSLADHVTVKQPLCVHYIAEFLKLEYQEALYQEQKLQRAKSTLGDATGESFLQRVGSGMTLRRASTENVLP